MNYDKVPRAFKWMLTTSFFHAAYEALLVNELRYLQLIEHKVSLSPYVISIYADDTSLVWIYKFRPQPVSFVSRRRAGVLLIPSPVLIRISRPGVLVARRITARYRVWNIHRTKLRRPGGLCQGEEVNYL